MLIATLSGHPYHSHFTHEGIEQMSEWFNVLPRIIELVRGRERIQTS